VYKYVTKRHVHIRTLIKSVHIELKIGIRREIVNKEKKSVEIVLLLFHTSNDIFG